MTSWNCSDESPSTLNGNLKACNDSLSQYCPDTEPHSNSASSNDNTDLSTGAIAGISIASVAVGGAALAGIAYFAHSKLTPSSATNDAGSESVNTPLQNNRNSA